MNKIIFFIVFALFFSVSVFAQKAENPALSERIVRAFEQKLPGWSFSQHPKILHGGITSNPTFKLIINDNENRKISVSVSLKETPEMKEQRFEMYFMRAIMPPDSSKIENYVEKGFMVGTANWVDALFSKANLMVSIDAQFPRNPKNRKTPPYYLPAPPEEKARVLKIVQIIAETIDGDVKTDECQNTFYKYPVAPNETPENKLLIAVASGDAGEVSKILRQNVSPNTQISKKMDFADPSYDEGSTALHLAARQGCAEVIRTLIDAKANVNAVNAREKTPLMYAAYHNNAEAARVLINAGADPKLESYKHNAAFFAVQAMQMIQAFTAKPSARVQKMSENARIILRELDAKGLDLKKKEAWNGNTLLTALLSSAHGKFAFDLTETLIEYGVDPNEPNNDGKTPLLILANSISNDRPALMKLLIAKGADVNKPDKNNRTPLRVLLDKQSESQNTEYSKYINEAIAVLVNAGAKE